MGAWGLDSFENDQAQDWLYDLLQTDDLSLLEECLNIQNLNDGLDECIGTDLIAACEIISALLKKPAKNLPDDARTWVENHNALDVSHLKEKSINCLKAVTLDDSGLNQLWQETESYNDWLEKVEAIKDRILNS